MRWFGILVPTVVFLCGSLPAAGYEKQAGLEVIEYEENDRAYWKPYGLALRREPRDVASQLAGALGRVSDVFLKAATELPANAIGTIASAIHRILSVIAIAFRSLLLPIRVFLNDSSRADRAGPLCAMEHLLSLTIVNPQQAIGKMASFVRDRAVSLLERALIATWQFLSSTGLPWLRRTLDRVQQLPDVPDTVRAMITSFVTFYNIAQLLGFVSPAY